MALIQTIDGRYVNLDQAYIRPGESDEGEPVFVIVSTTGQPCAAFEQRSHLYFWAVQHGVLLVTLH